MMLLNSCVSLVYSPVLYPQADKVAVCLQTRKNSNPCRLTTVSLSESILLVPLIC